MGKPLLYGTTDAFLKRFGLSSIEALPNYNELLDRIRVIHSDGDSLYREFSIPDEEPENSATEKAEAPTKTASEQQDETPAQAS